MRRPMHRQPGFTLIELMVASVIVIVAIGAVMGTLQMQNTAYMRESDTSTAQDNARAAIDEIAERLRLAGFGIDPQLAFDFDFYKCSFPDGSGAGMTQRTACAALQRDSATAPDELIVSYRNPRYDTAGVSPCDSSGDQGNVWSLLSAGSGGVTVELKPGDTIRKGQILQVLCSGANMYTYVTASATAAVPPGGACNRATIGVYPAVSNDPFNQPGELTQSCFSNGLGKVFLVDRYRYFIQTDSSDPQHPHPYLMLDRGMDMNGDSNLTDDDLIPVAADIEDLQVSYGMEHVDYLAAAKGSSAGNLVTDSNGDGVWGDDPAGVQEQPSMNSAAVQALFSAVNANYFGGQQQNCQNVSANLGFGVYTYPCVMDKDSIESNPLLQSSYYRWVPWSGNITTVRVSVIGRPALPLGNDRSVAGTFVVPALENRPAFNVTVAGAIPAGYTAEFPPTLKTGYRRTVLGTTIRPVNLTATGLVIQ